MRSSPISLAFAALIGLLALDPRAVRAADLSASLSAQPTAAKFLGALRAAGLDKELAAAKKLTVFAPTDDAIDKMPIGLWNKLHEPANKAALLAMLKHHLVPGDYPSARLVGARAPQFTIPTMARDGIRIDRRRALKAEDAALYRLDVKADNGTIHIVDKVLLPAKARTLASQPDKRAKPKA